ncbi:DUF4286 family protein [Rothia halotolerans]|uniref:DUF4286 family protein n=1 Tax=Rothia halotolerans TaxID=405770 RepID=UPI00101D577E|nr:DUF4286 family protein [Rothia halotolerans]
MPPHPADETRPEKHTWLFELPGVRWDVQEAREAAERVPEADVDILTAFSEEETWIWTTAPTPPGTESGGEAAGFLAAMLGVERDALPEFRHRRLRELLKLGDAVDGVRQPWLYTSQTDIPPAVEEEFNRWFDEEHLPQLAAVEGTVHAARYRTDGSPRYLACYDLRDREIQGGAEWREAIESPWRDRIHPRFLGPRKLMLKRLL